MTHGLIVVDLKYFSNKQKYCVSFKFKLFAKVIRYNLYLIRELNHDLMRSGLNLHEQQLSDD